MKQMYKPESVVFYTYAMLLHNRNHIRSSNLYGARNGFIFSKWCENLILKLKFLGHKSYAIVCPKVNNKDMAPFHLLLVFENANGFKM